MLVCLSLLLCFALRDLWTNLDFLRHMTFCLHLRPTPMARKCCPHMNKGEHGQCQMMIIARAKLGEVIAAATSVTPDGKERHTVQALCGDAGRSNLKWLWISNVSYTCNYLGSRLKYLHRQLSFISRKAHCVSRDFSRALPSVIKSWWLIEGQVRKSWGNMLSPWSGLRGLSNIGGSGVHLRLSEKQNKTKKQQTSCQFNNGVLTRICFSSKKLRICTFVTESLMLTKTILTAK